MPGRRSASSSGPPFANRRCWSGWTAQDNHKGKPNENLARELMELFTLGIGHYTEADVKEAARALTGWTVEGDSFREDPAQHDDGEKVLLGRRGRWTGTDLVAMLLEHPATAERLAWRICDTFLGEGDIDAAGIRLLASGLRQRDLDIGWAVGTVLRSRAFHEGRGRRGRVVSPVEFVVGAVRALELFDPPPSTLLLAEWATRLGQDLFYPPNVGGWPGGRSWISAGAMIGRTNYAAALAGGRDIGLPGPPDVLAPDRATRLRAGPRRGDHLRHQRAAGGRCADESVPVARGRTPVRSRGARRRTPYPEPGPVLARGPEVLTPIDRTNPFPGRSHVLSPFLSSAGP